SEIDKNDNDIMIPLEYIAVNRNNSNKKISPYIGRDNYDIFEVFGGKSIIFFVDDKYIKNGYDLIVNFNYKWEQRNKSNFGLINHRIIFILDDIIKQRKY